MFPPDTDRDGTSINRDGSNHPRIPLSDPVVRLPSWDTCELIYQQNADGPFSWGDRAACEVSMAIHANSTLGGHLVEESVNGLSDSVLKLFHPKSIAHYMVAQKTFRVMSNRGR
jgi:hypothetical protein